MPEQLISFITTCFRPEAVAIDQPNVTAGDFSQEYLSCTRKKDRSVSMAIQSSDQRPRNQRSKEGGVTHGKRN